MSVLYDRLYNDHSNRAGTQALDVGSAGLPSRQHREELLRYHNARLRPARAPSLLSRIKALFDQ